MGSCNSSPGIAVTTLKRCNCALCHDVRNKDELPVDCSLISAIRTDIFISVIPPVTIDGWLLHTGKSQRHFQEIICTHGWLDIGVLGQINFAKDIPIRILQRIEMF